MIYLAIAIAFVAGLFFVLYKGYLQAREAELKNLPGPAIAPPAKVPPKKGEVHPPKSIKPEQAKKKGRFSPTTLSGIKMATEGAEYGIKICAALIGLALTFSLNTYRVEKDKKKHLADVLGSVREKIANYGDFLNLMDTIRINESDSMSSGVFIKNYQHRPYPYFSDIRDPVIYEMTRYSQNELGNQDNNVRIDLESAHVTPATIKDLVAQLRFFASISYDQLSAEIDYQSGKIDSAVLRRRSNGIFQRGKDAVLKASSKAP